MIRTFDACALAAVCLLLAPTVGAAEPPATAPPTTPPPANAEPAVAPVNPATPSETAAPAGSAGSVATPSPEAAAVEPIESSGGGLFEQSQSAVTTAAEGEAPARLFDLNGYVRGDAFVGKQQDTGSAMVHAAYGELAFKLTALKQTHGDAFADVRFRYGQEGARRGVSVNLREAYVNLYLGPLDLRLGQQVIVWGRADAFNPTNNLTPIDLRVRSPLEDDRRMGNVGARAFLNFSPIRLEGVWMPLYVASELPDIPLPPDVVFGEPEFPAPTLKEGLYAARVHLELPAFEASVSALQGNAPLPGMDFGSFTVGPDAEVRIARAAYKQRVFGADFSTAIGDILGVRGEVAYRRPIDYWDVFQAPRPDLQYVLGLDRAFGSVNVIVQYVGRYVFDWQREPGSEEPLNINILRIATNPPSEMLTNIVYDGVTEQLRQTNQILFAQTERVQHAVSARVEWLTLQDTLSLSALGLVNFSTEEWLLYPKLNYKISDSLSTSIGAEIYGGPDRTLFGAIDELLSAGYAELKLAF